MTNLLKSIVFITAISLSCYSFAGFFNNKLVLYKCPQSTDVNSCSSVCKADSPAMEAEFKINKSERAVQVIVFDGGKQIGSMYLDKCVIFDDKNWKCEPDQYSIGSKRMANGVYSDDVQLIGVIKGMAPMQAAKICGK